MFTPTWWNDPSWRINIFQMGWNHQLGMILPSHIGIIISHDIRIPSITNQVSMECHELKSRVLYIPGGWDFWTINSLTGVSLDSSCDTIILWENPTRGLASHAEASEKKKRDGEKPSPLRCRGERNRCSPTDSWRDKTAVVVVKCLLGCCWVVGVQG